MNRILIVSNTLTMGGAEKLLYELVCFAKENNIQPTILILDNYDAEHYDNVFDKLNVQIVRTRIKNIAHFRAPLKMIRSICWLLKLKFFADRIYDSMHVMGLYNADKVLSQVQHKHRFFWNVNNTIQFFDEIYPYSQDIFKDEQDTIVCINKYQIDEIHRQYGAASIRAKLVLFKLFISAHDTN